MPKTAMDYSKCSIYKIEHVDDDSLVYVGHTTNFNKRKTQHKYNCYNQHEKKYNLKLYQMIRENGGWDTFRMIEVEKYPCNDRREADKRETEVMKDLQANLNMIKSYVERKEYTKEHYLKNIESIKERKKKHRENNIDTYRVKEREKNEKNKEKNQERIKCPCGCIVAKPMLNRHQLTKKHVDMMKDDMEKLDKVKCECGFYSSKGHLKRHQNSKYHIDIMKKISI